MTKKVVSIFLGISITILTLLNVNADEIYYTNANNVSMTEDQYNFFGEMFWDGFQDEVTSELYNHYLTAGYFDGEIEKSVYDENKISNLGDSSRGTVHETTAKKLTLSKSCGSSTCAISVTLQWKGTPNIKSYDVIGALLYNNVSLSGEPDTFFNYSGGTLAYGDEYYVGGGFGTSVKLRTSSTLMKIWQIYDVYGSGTVYASYQHATSNITKATSQLYTVGFGGYGGVFHFYGNAYGVFDGMGGVNTTISI